MEKVIDFRLRPPWKSFASFELFSAKADWFRGYWETEPIPSITERSMDLLLKEMDEAGVVHGVVPGRPEAQAEAAGASSNEDIVTLVRVYPGRFTGFAGINISGDLDQTLYEVDAAIGQKEFAGITLEPGLAKPPRYVDDAKLYPIYEKCQARDTPVMLMMSGFMGPRMTYASPVAVDNIAADFPRLKIIIPHACWPFVIEACHVAFKRTNVYLQPDIYGVSFPGHLHYAEAANLFLEDRIFFGTCYPEVSHRTFIAEYKKLPLRPEVREKLFYKNAASLLGLSL